MDTVEKEIYRLEINSDPVCIITTECPEWAEPRLDPTWLRFVVADAIRHWHLHQKRQALSESPH